MSGFVRQAPSEAPIQPNATYTRSTKPYSIKCPRFDCYYSTAHASETAAHEAWQDHLHHCPMEGASNQFLEERDERGQRYTMIRFGKSPLEKLWDLLDAAFDEYQGLTDQHQIAMMQGRMRGLAEAIQMMSFHYFPTTDDVVREEMFRRDVRTGKEQFMPTPGYKYNPPPKDSPLYEKANRVAAVAAPSAPTGTPAPKKRAAPKPAVSPEVEAKLKNALGMGLFTDQELADSFKLPVSYISGLRESS